MLCASPAYVARRGQPTSPDELASHDCIRALDAGRAEGWDFPRTVQGAIRPMTVRDRFQMNDAAAIRKAALAGFGDRRLAGISGEGRSDRRPVDAFAV